MWNISLAVFGFFSFQYLPVLHWRCILHYIIKNVDTYYIHTYYSYAAYLAHRELSAMLFVVSLSTSKFNLLCLFESHYKPNRTIHWLYKCVNNSRFSRSRSETETKRYINRINRFPVAHGGKTLLKTIVLVVGTFVFVPSASSKEKIEKLLFFSYCRPRSITESYIVWYKSINVSHRKKTSTWPDELMLLTCVINMLFCNMLGIQFCMSVCFGLELTKFMLLYRAIRGKLKCLMNVNIDLILVGQCYLMGPKVQEYEWNWFEMFQYYHIPFHALFTTVGRVYSKDRETELTVEKGLKLFWPINHIYLLGRSYLNPDK